MIEYPYICLDWSNYMELGMMRKNRLNHISYNGWSCICGCQVKVYHENGNILILWYWLNDEKQLFWCKSSDISNHSYPMINFNHVIQISIETLVSAADTNGYGCVNNAKYNTFPLLLVPLYSRKQCGWSLASYHSRETRIVNGNFRTVGRGRYLTITVH